MCAETSDGYVEVVGFTANAPTLVRTAVKKGDRVVAVDSSIGDQMWPVSTVEGVISACTSRLPGQQVTIRFERPEANMRPTATTIVGGEQDLLSTSEGTDSSGGGDDAAARGATVDGRQTR